MGRELVLQLVAAGCSVATCDLRESTVAATVAAAREAAPAGTNVTGHQCDVSNESDVQRFRDEVVAEHGTDHIDLLFNNAGIGGGGSFIKAARTEWERTFGVDWWGVYYCCRAFVPLLIASESACLVNTSSVNGFWASLGPGSPHTAYSAAKFAVKGFTEALIEDFRVNAPHVKVALVMPGHIGTDIVTNTMHVQGGHPDELTEQDFARMRADFAKAGVPNADAISEENLRRYMRSVGDGFRDSAPTTAAAAATVILDAVRGGEWRILVGDDAHALDEAVRADPAAAYAEAFSGLGTITRRR
jgi:NAD(P)-dependent dehydrogenase (short-subunit alcohol dehydrogenase family)